MENEKELYIQYLKSYLSVSTHIGCPLGCIYCSGQSFYPDLVEKITDPNSLVDDVYKYKLFRKDITPIVINNRSDPFLPKVRKSSMDILKRFYEDGIHNPVTFITKLTPTPEELSILDEGRLPVFLFVTYSGLDKKIEPFGHESQLNTFDLCNDRKNFKLIHYWRPIIPTINDSDEDIRKMLDTVSGKCDASVVSGMRVNKTTKKSLHDKGITAIDDYDYSKHKYLDKDFQLKIKKMAKEYNHEVFSHTSCAISTFMDKADYNLHSNTNFCDVCKNHSNCKENCGQVILDEFRKLDLNSPVSEDTDSIVRYQGAMTEEERSFLQTIFKKRIIPEELTLSVSEQLMAK